GPGRVRRHRHDAIALRTGADFGTFINECSTDQGEPPEPRRESVPEDRTADGQGCRGGRGQAISAAVQVERHRIYIHAKAVICGVGYKGHRVGTALIENRTIGRSGDDATRPVRRVREKTARRIDPVSIRGADALEWSSEHKDGNDARSPITVCTEH